MKLTCEKNKLTEAVPKVQIATSSPCFFFINRAPEAEYLMFLNEGRIPYPPLLRDTT